MNMPNSSAADNATPIVPEIVEVHPDDEQALSEVAAMHMELLDFGPMAGLGLRFIRDVGYRLHLEDGLLSVAICRVAGEPAGFVAYTDRSVSFHRSSLGRHFLKVSWILMLSLLADPRRIVKLVRALKVVGSRRSEQQRFADPLGEVVAIAVLRKFLSRNYADENGKRMSESLVVYAQKRLRTRGVDSMRMLVDADNKGALFFYHGMGARLDAYEQAGEPMVEVWFDLAAVAERPAVPPCWQEQHDAASEVDDWSDYWERLNDEQPIFLIEAQDYVSRLRSAIDLNQNSRVLDFGCGFGNISASLAPYVGRVAVWDSASNMRHCAYERLSAVDNVEFLDISHAEHDAAAGQFDYILVNSVVQYMSDEQLREWLKRWKAMLNPDGKLIISDIIMPQYSFIRDLLAFIRICLRNGVLLRSVWGGLKEIRNYGSVKASRPLSKLDEAAISKAAAEVSLDVRLLRENLTYHAGRLTAMFERQAT